MKSCCSTPKPAIILGTGPSLSGVADEVRQLKADGKVMLFGINNTYQDFNLDSWIACDPKWHEHYGQINGDFDKWHWDLNVCQKYGYKYIQGIWLDGLSTDPDYLSLGHASGWQALNLAVHYGCDPILLVGHDMRYPENAPRHYFNLSDVIGEYPAGLRKYSEFLKPDGSGLLTNYAHIADQCKRGEVPAIHNCTAGSAMTCFPMGKLADFA